MRYPIYRSFYTSYAGNDCGGKNCIDSGINTKCWHGITSGTNCGSYTYDTVCASTNNCGDARTAFLKKHGGGNSGLNSNNKKHVVDNNGLQSLDPLTGTLSSPNNTPVGNPNTKASKQAVKNALTDDGCGGKGVNSASGCCNCGSDWDLGTVSCNLFGKPSCEFQAYTRNGLKGLLDNSGKFLSDNLLFVAAGIGGILLITLLLSK